MSIHNWSDDIAMGEMVEDPVLSDDLEALVADVEVNPRNVVLNFSAVDFINSSNIAKLLQLRKVLHASDRRLLLCGINAQVWGVFSLAALDKIFECTNDTATALATLQMDAGEPA
jgi:anti-anti-sigma factor